MRRGEKEKLHAARRQQIPGERLDAELIRRKAGKLRMHRSQRLALRAFAAAEERGSPGQPRVTQQQPRKLRARVAGHSEYRDFLFCLHQPISPSNRAFSAVALFVSGQMIRTVLSPAIVPTTSGQPSSSMPAATG